MSIEVELKLEFEPAELARFRKWAHLRELTHSPVRRARLKARYFDTADHLLRNNHAALRIRQEFGGLVQTFKASLPNNGISRRLELDFDLKSPELDLSLLMENDRAREIFDHVNQNSLEEIFQTHVWRTIRLIRYEDTEIELAIDSGVILTPTHQEVVSEAELELKSGDEKHLQALAEEWQQHFSFVTGGPSKAARGYKLSQLSALS